MLPTNLLTFASFAVVPFDSDYELITTTLITTDTASVTFSSLGDYSSTYKHLQIRATGRTAEATTSNRNIALRLNADTGSNYSAHSVRGNGTAVASTGISSQTSLQREDFFVGNNATANIFGGAVVDVLDPYSSSKNTTIRILTGLNASASKISLMSGAWYNTASLTSIQIFVGNSENILAGSRFSLYGIRG